ncbi:MAG: polyphenol oxidase family protein [bacterium]|nr:polyphenol oxidase family protein [bacterium]
MTLRYKDIVIGISKTLVNGFTLIQKHTNIVKEANITGVGDGMYTYLNNRLVITVADCLPLYLIGTKSYGLLHCGWKGLKKGIVENYLKKVKDTKIAFAGPHIKTCCYEVGNEFLKYFPSSTYTFKGKLYMSLIEEAKNRLKKIPVIDFSICTKCSGMFNSYRAGSKNKNYAFIYSLNFFVCLILILM